MTVAEISSGIRYKKFRRMDEGLPAVPEFDMAPVRALLDRTDRLHSFGDAHTWTSEATERLTDLIALRARTEITIRELIGIRTRMLANHSQRGIVRWLFTAYPHRQTIENGLAQADRVIQSIDAECKRIRAHLGLIPLNAEHRAAIFDALILKKRELMRRKRRGPGGMRRREPDGRIVPLKGVRHPERSEIETELFHIDEWIGRLQRWH